MNRREFLAAATLGGAAATLQMRPAPAGAEAPPEITRLRLLKTGSICWAPQYVADALLQAEGFAEVTYVDMPTGAVSVRLAKGEGDLSSAAADDAFNFSRRYKRVLLSYDSLCGRQQLHSFE